MWPSDSGTARSRSSLGSCAKESESLVDEKAGKLDGNRSTTGHVQSGRKQGGPPSKAKYEQATDSGKYHEGKVKSTPGGE